MAPWMNVYVGDTPVPTSTPDVDSTSCVDDCSRLVVRSMPGHIEFSFADPDRTDRQTDDYPLSDIAHPGMPNFADTGWGKLLCEGY